MRIGPDQARRALQRYDNCERAVHRLQQAVPEAAEDEVAAAFWAAFRTGDVTFEAPEYVEWLAKAPGAYDADDVLALILHYADQFGADGSKGSGRYGTQLWRNHDLPGYFEHLYDLLAAKADDGAFLETVAKRRDELRAPYDDAVAYGLAQVGFLDPGDLPDGLLERAATTNVEDRGYREQPVTWREPTVWPDEVWGHAIVEAAKASEATFQNPEVLTELAEYADPDEMVAVAGQVAYGSGIMDGIEALVAYGEPMLAPLEEQLHKLDPDEIRRPYSNTGLLPRFPAFTLGAAYLKLCNRLDHCPDPDLDDRFAALAEHYKSRSNAEGKHEDIIEVLSLLPDDRIEAIVAGLDTVNFWVLGAAPPTQPVFDRIIEALQSDEEIGYTQHRFALRPGLSALGVEGRPLFRALIEGEDFEHKSTVIEALADIEADEIAPLLVEVLHDRRKTYRAPAREGLAELSDEVVLDELPSALHAGRKHARLAAAHVLARLPKSRRRYELAQKQLDDERTQDVKDILKKIDAPEDVEEDVDEEQIRAALAEDLSNWRLLADEVGIELVRVFVDHLSDTTSALHWDDEVIETVYALVEHFADHPDAAAYAAEILPPAQKLPRWRSFLHGLTERVDGFLEAAADLVKADRFHDVRRMEGQDLVQWMARQAPANSKAAFFTLLDDRRTTIRRPAATGLARFGPSGVEDVGLYLLDDNTTADGREAAAWALEAIGSPDALPYLDDALEHERSPRVAEAIESAIVACRNAALDVADVADTAEGDRELDDALASLKLDRPAPFPDALPPLRWAAAGEPLSEAATDWVLATLHREDRETHNDQLVAVRNRLADESCHALCDALVDAAPHDDRGWGLYVRAVLGSEEHIDEIGAPLEALAAGADTAWGTDAVEVLRRHGSRRAISWLDHWCRTTDRTALRTRARAALRTMAEARGGSVDTLVLRAMPTFGFDESTEQRVDYGSRDIIVRLDLDDGLAFEDDKGVVRDWFPTPRTADDEATVQAAKDRFRGKKRRVKRLMAGVADRLETAMISGRTWPLAEWHAMFVQQPIARAVTRTLLFEAREEEGGVPIPFAVSGDGTGLDAEGMPVEWPAGSTVGVVHPIDLDERMRSRWRAHFEWRDAEPPFPQLGRELHPAGERPAGDASVLAELPSVHPGTFRRRLTDRGYERGPRRDGGQISLACTSIADYNVQVEHEGYSPDVLDEAGEISMQQLLIWRGDERDLPLGRGREHIDPLMLDEVPARIASEIVRDLRYVTDA